MNYIDFVRKSMPSEIIQISDMRLYMTDTIIPLIPKNYQNYFLDTGRITVHKCLASATNPPQESVQNA